VLLIVCVTGVSVLLIVCVTGVSVILIGCVTGVSVLQGRFYFKRGCVKRELLQERCYKRGCITTRQTALMTEL
jgi:hypothetical protein